jgi:DhnA family fructose-bisphosphate aldolase class Ia
MNRLGKQVRLGRLFRYPMQRYFCVAIDHLIIYPSGMPKGLRNIRTTLPQIVAGEPSAIVMTKGIAKQLMPEFAGRIPFIVQQMALRAEEPVFSETADVAETAAMGADAIAVAMFVKCKQEITYIGHLTRIVREAEKYGLPVIPHIYPLSSGDEHVTVVHNPEDVFYAARVGWEAGADVVKVPFTGDTASFRDIVAATPVPIVAAGGPRCETLDDAEAFCRAVVRSGSPGLTMGRNVWGFDDIPLAMQRLREAVYASEGANPSAPKRATA